MQYKDSNPKQISSQNLQLGQTMRKVFSKEYLDGLSEEQKGRKQTEIWLKKLDWLLKEEKSDFSEKKRKQVECNNKNLLENRKQRSKQHWKKAQISIKTDQKTLNSLLNDSFQLSPLDKQLDKLLNEKEHLNEDLKQLLDRLQDKIEEECKEQNKMTYSRNIIYGTTNQSSNKDLECLQYLINSLEEKQIAESVSKIVSTERTVGETLFRVQFENAMNIEGKLITEKELNRINFLRETSLVNFYRTGVKSPYSFICHNYAGFRQLMQNRLGITPKLRDKDLMQMMKKGACMVSIAEIQQEMNKFSMCHHCKYIYQEHLLFTCKFTSDKQSIPKQGPDSNSDPNLAEAFQEGLQRNRTSQRFLTRRKNCMTSYAKIHEEYVCGRKYCISCIKDNYSHDHIKQTGLCPFCQGICICSRCLRNQKIVKFKAMYSILGGDLNELLDKSIIEKLQLKSEDSIQRGRGRPRKYIVSHLTSHVARTKLGKMSQRNSLWRRRGWEEGRKKNDSGNETQQELGPRNRIKRKIGRPKLNNPHH